MCKAGLTLEPYSLNFLVTWAKLLQQLLKVSRLVQAIPEQKEIHSSLKEQYDQLDKNLQDTYNKIKGESKRSTFLVLYTWGLLLWDKKMLQENKKDEGAVEKAARQVFKRAFKLQNIPKTVLHQKIALKIGNTYLLDLDQVNCQHEWTLYITNSKGGEFIPFVKKVIVNLHPTYKVQTFVFRRPPYKLARHAWGHFKIYVEIHFVREYYQGKPIKLEHHLVYEPGGSFYKWTFDLKSGHKKVKKLPKK